MKPTILIVCLLAALRSSALFAGLLDQSYTPGGGNALIIEDTQSVAQIFTVGRTGLLDQVSVEVARHRILAADPMVFELRSVQPDGRPSDSILVTQDIPAAQISTEFQMLDVNLRPFGLMVAEGDLFAIVLRSDAGYVAPGGGLNPYGWHGDIGSYARGNTYMFRPGMESWGLIVFDFGFATYVDPQTLHPVPEPSAFGFASAGGLLLLIAIRRNRRRDDCSPRTSRC